MNNISTHLFYFTFTSDRMPISIGEFISDAMYDGQLHSSHSITTPACWFVDIDGSNEKKYLTSWEASIKLFC